MSIPDLLVGLILGTTLGGGLVIIYRVTFDNTTSVPDPEPQTNILSPWAEQCIDHMRRRSPDQALDDASLDGEVWWCRIVPLNNAEIPVFMYLLKYDGGWYNKFDTQGTPFGSPVIGAAPVKLISTTGHLAPPSL